MDNDIKKALLEIEEEIKAMDGAEFEKRLANAENNRFSWIFDILDMVDENEENYTNTQKQSSESVSWPNSSTTSQNSLSFSTSIMPLNEPIKELIDHCNVDYELELPWTAA